LWFESLEEKFGPYPYKTYGHVTVSPIDFGGMEHQTMSTINRFWLRGTAELGYVHELGHQWIGDYVTCATWADIWLNEGGASFSEALYGEYVKGKESYAKVLRNKRDRYMRRGLAEPPVYNIPLAMIFNEATTYNKSSWVYHMMRRMVGDSLFFPTLRSYMAKYAHGSAQTYQFKQHFVENIPNPPVSWDVFFDQWLVQAGHPRFFALVSNPSAPSGATVPVTIKISQEQLQVIPTVFEVPLTLRVQWGSRWYDTTIVMKTPTVEVKYEFPNDGSTLSFPDPASPASLIDPEESLLCERFGEIVTSVQDQTRDTGVRLIGPAPASDVVTVEVSDGPAVTCTWIGLNGEVLATSIIDSGIRMLDVASLPSGMLHLRMERAGTTAVFAAPVIH
jgi:aminopeptidase N